MVKYLVEERGITQYINTRRIDNRWTTLHEATSKGYLEITEFLISKGAVINPSDKYGNTPLHKATMRGDLDIVKLLASNRANLNPKNGTGLTPLHYATKNGHLEIVRFLVENGANLNLPDKRGITPLQYANEDIKEMLLRGAPPSSSMEIVNVAGPSRSYENLPS
ncbi:ankyrin repeat domain-containing protein [Wolbachia pipientis]